jgi:hypothetical protein
MEALIARPNQLVQLGVILPEIELTLNKFDVDASQ